MAKTRTVRKQIRAEKYAAVYCRGTTQIEAWREMMGEERWKDMTDAAQSIAARRFHADPITQLTLEKFRQRISVASMDSAVKYWQDLGDKIAAAEEAGNWNAVMQGMRIRGQSAGHLTETVRLTDDRKLDDLLPKIAAINPALVPLLKQMIGIEDEPTGDNVTPITAGKTKK